MVDLAEYDLTGALADDGIVHTAICACKLHPHHLLCVNTRQYDMYEQTHRSEGLLPERAWQGPVEVRRRVE